jgi:hypothetical protein
MRNNVERPEANLSRERQRLLFMEAVCGSPEAAAHNSQVIDQRTKIALIEKLLATNSSA